MTLNQMQRGTGKERKAVTEKKNKLTKKKPGEEAENEVDGYCNTVTSMVRSTPRSSQPVEIEQSGEDGV